MKMHIIFGKNDILSNQFCAIYNLTFKKLAVSPFADDVKHLYDMYGVAEVDAHALDDTLKQYATREVMHDYGSIDFHTIDSINEVMRSMSQKDVLAIHDLSTLGSLTSKDYNALCDCLSDENKRLMVASEASTHNLLMNRFKYTESIARLNYFMIKNLSLKSLVSQLA